VKAAIRRCIRVDGGEVSHVSSSEPEATSRPAPAAPRAWDDSPLRVKVTLLVLLATALGSLVGLAEARFGSRSMLLLPTLSVVVTAMLWLGYRWVCRPVDRLVAQVDALVKQGRPDHEAPLPVARGDEVGRLARAMLQVATQSLRDHHEATRLRRTLDHRVEQATRRATQQLEQLAMRDPMTDLGNRRFLQTSLGSLVDSVRQADADLLCFAIDMDNFKKVNDTLGHAAGDELLIFVGTLIRATMRRDDYAVRLGGDEFVVLMPNCTMERGQQFGEQLAKLFRQHARVVTQGHDMEVGLSVGMSSLKADACKDGESLIEAADTRLLAAKRAGKGRLVGA
jgi:two-component system cell cycle response regulator